MNPEKKQIDYIRFGFSFLDLNILQNQWLGCNALQQFVKEPLFLREIYNIPENPGNLIPYTPGMY